MKRLLTRNEACERLGGISFPSLHKLMNENRISKVKVGGRTFIDINDLDAYIESVTTKAA